MVFDLIQGHTLLQRAALTTFPFNFTSNGTTTTLTLSVFRCHQSLHHERLIFIPTYTKIGPSPRVDVNNNQLQQEEQDDLEVRVEKIIYRCRFLATFGVFGYLIVEINRESGDNILYYLKNFIFLVSW